MVFYKLDYEKFKLKRRKKKVSSNQETENSKTENLENHCKLSSFVSSFSSLNNEDNKYSNIKLVENSNLKHVRFNELIEINEKKYHSNNNLKNEGQELSKKILNLHNSSDFLKTSSNNVIENKEKSPSKILKLIPDEPKEIIETYNSLKNSSNINLRKNFIKSNLYLKLNNTNNLYNKLANRNLQSCFDLRIFRKNINLMQSEIFNKRFPHDQLMKPEKRIFLSSYNITSIKPPKNNLNLSLLESNFNNFFNKSKIQNTEEISNCIKTLEKIFNSNLLNNKDFKKFNMINYNNIKDKLRKSFKSTKFFSSEYLPHRPNKHILLSNLGIFFKDTFFENKIFLEKIKKVYNTKIFPENNLENNQDKCHTEEKNSKDDLSKIDNNINDKEEIIQRNLSSEFNFNYPIKIRNMVNDNFSRIFIKPNQKFISVKNRYLKISNKYIDDNIFEMKNNIIRLKEYFKDIVDLIQLKNFSKKIQVEYISLKGVLKGFLFYSEKKKNLIFVDENTINTLISKENLDINSSFEKLIERLKNNNNMPDRKEFLFTSLKTDFINKFKIFVKIKFSNRVQTQMVRNFS